MQATLPLPVSKKGTPAGHIMTALVVLFMTFDGVIKLMRIGPVLEGLDGEMAGERRPHRLLHRPPQPVQRPPRLVHRTPPARNDRANL